MCICTFGPYPWHFLKLGTRDETDHGTGKDAFAVSRMESGKLSAAMVTIEPIRVEIDREDDGRILASVPALPGVMAYGNTEIEAVRKVKTIALAGVGGYD